MLLNNINFLEKVYQKQQILGKSFIKKQTNFRQRLSNNKLFRQKFYQKQTSFLGKILF